MSLSIVNYADQETYGKVYCQYNDLLKSLAWSNEEKFVEYHQLEGHNLQLMIQENLDQLYWQAL
jgi:hypothetical protein